MELKGKALGGKSKAQNMTPEERKALSEKMVNAKRELASLPQATHTGTLKLVDKEIPCAVLEDGTRLLTQSDFMEAMGMYYSGWIANNAPDNSSLVSAEIPHFLAQKSLIPFINKRLGHLQNIVLRYRTEKGSAANGIRAEIIPSICDVYLDADKEGKLGARQKKIAEQAYLLMRALAHVGIVALIDEATGYQRDRARDALAKILEEFVAKEIQPWVKTFDSEFYEEMFRLRGLPYPPDQPNFKPQYFGKLTNDIVYKRLAPGVLTALKEESKKSEKKGRLHQHLSAGYGKQALLKHLGKVVALMSISDNWDDFMIKLDKISPQYGETVQLDF